MKQIVALFDCDGTIFSAGFGRGLIKYTAANGGEWRVRGLYAALLLPYIIRKTKLITSESFLRSLMARLAWLIKGWDEEQVRIAFEWVVHEYLRPTQQEDVVARLRDHQAKDHKVLLVSAQFIPALILYGTFLAIDGVIGTQIELVDGRYTGRIIPPMITTKQKAVAAQEYFASRAIEVDWAESFAYADSITDSDLLNLVGTPIAVYPDAKLHMLAQRKNWEILGIPK
ncbi:MAG: HAD-IB family hydrolase [Chloroflexota bacterium]